MKRSKMKPYLVNNPDAEVIVHVEGECYYPVKSIFRANDGKLIILCKNIKKVEE